MKTPELEKAAEAGQPVRYTRKRRLPFSMVVLLAGLLLLALAGWMRMLDSINDWYWYITFNVQPGPLYLVISGALWGLAGLAAVAWFILRRWQFPIVGTGAALFFLLTYWIDRLMIEQANGPGENTWFAAGISLISIVYVLLVLRPDLAWRRIWQKANKKLK